MHWDLPSSVLHILSCKSGASLGVLQQHSEAPDAHDGLFTCGQMQYTQVRLLMNMIGYAVLLMANAVHLSGAPDVLYMIVSTVHLMANVVHPSVGLDVR